MAEITKVKVEPDRAGIAKFCKSPEMQALLGDVAGDLSAGANAMTTPSRAHVREFKVPPYVHETVVLDNTAIGVARTNGPIGRYLENRYKYLSGQNH